MLTLMLALLGTLTLSTNAATFSVAPPAPFTNFTVVTYEDDDLTRINTHSAVDISPSFQQCQPPYATDPGDRCYCWGESIYYAVDRELMTIAIDWACGILTGDVGEPVMVYGMAKGLQHGETSSTRLRDETMH